MSDNKYYVTTQVYSSESHREENDVTVSVHSIAHGITPGQMANLLSDYVNIGCDRHGLAIGKALCSEHRTLQRSVIVLCVKIVCGLADQQYTDARNEDAIALAKRIKALYEEHGAGMFI